jgi:hypothetical protein
LRQLEDIENDLRELKMKRMIKEANNRGEWASWRVVEPSTGI